jgi:hypothetical protein
MGSDYLVWHRANLAKHRRGRPPNPFPSLNQASAVKFEEIAEAVAKLPPDQLARFTECPMFPAGR